MAELTQQDRENYTKLRDAVATLQKAIRTLGDQLPQHKLLKGLVETLLAEAQFSSSPNTIEELESRLDRVDGYLASQRLLLDASSLNEAQQNAIAQSTQTLLNQSALIKASLQDIEDSDLSTLDDLNPPCVDALFMTFLPAKEKGWTEKLLDGRLPALKDEEIQLLIDAWGTAVYKVAEDARQEGEKDGKLFPGKLDTIFRFFCIHEELEALYDRLSTLAV